MTPETIKDRFLAVIKARWAAGPLKTLWRNRWARKAWVLLKRRTRTLTSGATQLLKTVGSAIWKALKALYNALRKASLPVVAVAANAGAAIRKTATWAKNAIQRLHTRHRLFIATSVSYRDALAGAMALAAALIGIRKEIATLLGMAISSLQRFFAQRVFIDDVDDEDGDEELQPTWRPRPSW